MDFDGFDMTEIHDFMPASLPKKIRTYFFFGNWNHHPKPTHISNSPLEAEEEPGEAFRAAEQAIFWGLFDGQLTWERLGKKTLELNTSNQQFNGQN